MCLIPRRIKEVHSRVYWVTDICQALVPNPLSPNPLGQAPTQSNPVQRPNQLQGDWG